MEILSFTSGDAASACTIETKQVRTEKLDQVKWLLKRYCFSEVYDRDDIIYGKTPDGEECTFFFVYTNEESSLIDIIDHIAEHKFKQFVLCVDELTECDFSRMNQEQLSDFFVKIEEVFKKLKKSEKIAKYYITFDFLTCFIIGRLSKTNVSLETVSAGDNQISIKVLYEIIKQMRGE